MAIYKTGLLVKKLSNPTYCCFLDLHPLLY
jgi:hypothetical protein